MLSQTVQVGNPPNQQAKMTLLYFSRPLPLGRRDLGMVEKTYLMYLLMTPQEPHVPMEDDRHHLDLCIYLSPLSHLVEEVREAARSHGGTTRQKHPK